MAGRTGTEAHLFAATLRPEARAFGGVLAVLLVALALRLSLPLLLAKFVDDAIDGLRRSTSQALGDVSADSPPEPARTALTPTQRRELALEVRAANASVSAPVDVALEADLERQIAEMELAAKDLEVKRAELKSPAGLSEDEGPSAAEIEAMEAELTRPLSAEQADAIERAYAPGSPYRTYWRRSRSLHRRIFIARTPYVSRPRA